MTRRFHVRTFGCQMNEHDSERIAGLLAAQGMERSDDAESADVVVLNTCCIRENADNKLYGQLGHLKSLKARRPGLQIAVGGCLAQKDRERIVERAAHVDVVFGTHNLHRAAELLDEARRADGPLVEIADEHRPDAASLDAELPAARVAAHAAWVTIQIGCDNSCTFCIVPIVRGPEVSRRMGDVVREVEELAAGGVREIDAPRPERQLVRARSRCRAVEPALRRSPARGRRGRRDPPDPLHLTPSQGPAGRHHRGDGGVPMPSASSSICRCKRGATGRSHGCTVATRSSATWRDSKRREQRSRISR